MVQAHQAATDTAATVHHVVTTVHLLDPTRLATTTTAVGLHLLLPSLDLRPPGGRIPNVREVAGHRPRDQMLRTFPLDQIFQCVLSSLLLVETLAVGIEVVTEVATEVGTEVDRLTWTPTFPTTNETAVAVAKVLRIATQMRHLVRRRMAERGERIGIWMCRDRRRESGRGSHIEKGTEGTGLISGGREAEVLRGIEMGMEDKVGGSATGTGRILLGGQGLKTGRGIIMLDDSSTASSTDPGDFSEVLEGIL